MAAVSLSRVSITGRQCAASARRAEGGFEAAHGRLANGDGIFCGDRSGRCGRPVAGGRLGRGRVADLGGVDGGGGSVLSPDLWRQLYIVLAEAALLGALSVAGDFCGRASGRRVTGLLMRMQKISAYILAFNEAEKIRAAVETVLVGRRDRRRRFREHRRHREIAASLGARVVQVPFEGFGDLRNRAIEACRYDWIFSLDSDERCTTAVRDEILALLAGRAAARRLSGAAPQLHHGPLDPRFRLVSELPPAAALPQRQHALHARSGARGL